MIARLQVHAVVVAIKVCFALKLLGARLVTNHGGTWVRILALWVVCLHVRLPIVAPFEEFATDSTLMGRLFRCGPLALLLDAVDTW